VSPIKIVIIAILLYLGYRLLVGKTKDGEKGKGKDKDSGTGKEVGSEPVTDVLVEDPVCHTLIPRQQAIRLKDDDHILYFCSEKCCNQFVNNKGDA
jgi:YHS domain-containing protein